MSTNVINFQPPAPPHTAEPLEAAVLEVSGRIAEDNFNRRRHHSRLGELASGDLSLRRKCSREFPAQLTSVTFYSIEEVA